MSETPSNPPSSGPAGAATPARRPRRAGYWIWTIVILLILAAIAFYFYYRHLRKRSQAAKPVPAAVAVSVEPARQGDLPIYVNALGLVTPVATVNVTSLVDGQIISVNYGEGEMVQKGASLVEIDPRPFEAQLAVAEGQLQRDQALLENARLDLERYQTAYAQKAVPQQQLATQTATVHQDEGNVKVDEGQVQTAKLQLSYCHITSPITGMVGLRLVDVGNIVHAAASTPLVAVTQLQPITVEFSVSEDYLPQIRKPLAAGQSLAVEAYDRVQQNRLADGSLLALNNLIDTGTGTLKMRAIFTNADAALFPNQFVNVKLQVSTLHNATLVLAAVVQRSAEGAFLYLIKPDNTAAMQPVEVEATEGNISAVKGLAPGQIIATDNFNRLQQGMKVLPRPAPPAAGQVSESAPAL